MTAPVLLVGAGPGDPDLLTLRAAAALAAATLVVSDPSVAPLARAFAPRAVVVEAGGDVAAILATADGAAVRLYRGDPWMHRALAGEAAALRALGVPFEAVPGPVAELALLASDGVAVHHRPVSVTVTLALADDLPPTAPARTLVAEAPG